MDLTLFCMCFLSWVFHRRAAFLPAVSGIVGKGLERETLLSFPRLRRFGTHNIRCAQIRKHEFWNAESYGYCVSSPWQPKSKDACGKLPCIRGLSAISFSSCFLIGTHLTGSKFLLLFSIKSKKEHLCFAVRVLNWRISYLHKAKFRHDCAHPVRSTVQLHSPKSWINNPLRSFGSNHVDFGGIVISSSATSIS